MWNRPAMVLWVSVRIQNPPGKRRFAFGVPVPTLLLCQWADMAEDVLTAAKWFPGVRNRLDFIPAAAIAAAIRQTARELSRSGPTDLVDVDVESPGGHRVQVKCLLR
ncbi:hypothetical protein [Caproicibacter fermentans]|nr:hypothetical protein [Caproicibacter fermentans]